MVKKRYLYGGGDGVEGGTGMGRGTERGVLNDVLESHLPHELIHEVGSYLIKKLDPLDERYGMLWLRFGDQRFRLREQWYNDGKWMRTLIRFRHPDHVLLVGQVPKNFVDYSFQHMVRRERHDVRCWLRDNFIRPHTLPPPSSHWEHYHDGTWVTHPYAPRFQSLVS
jgi:hypothetical protein